MARAGSTPVARVETGRGGGDGTPPPENPDRDWNSGDGSYRPRFTPNLYQIATLVVLVSISVFFIALALAYADRIAAQPEWKRYGIPRVLWFSTILLAFSSLALEMGRRSLRYGQIRAWRWRLAATTALGLLFLAAQALSWNSLVHQGVFVRGNPHGSVFYMFTGLHGLHLLGGVCLLAYLLFLSNSLPGATEQALRRHRTIAASAALYWHFMGILWACLFFLLYQWL